MMKDYNPNKIGCYEGWMRHTNNPVIQDTGATVGSMGGEVADSCVLKADGKY